MDTYETQGTDERQYFSGDLRRLWVQEQPCFGHQVTEHPMGREAEGGEHSFLSGTECGISLWAPGTIA